jgi:predicted MFS family arabinose efflux permease
VLVASEMLLLSYLVPYLDAVSSGGMLARASLFAVAGGAGVLGVWAGGIASDRWGHAIVLTCCLSGLVVVMGVLSSLWLLGPVDLRLVAAATTVWGFVSFAALPAVHARLFHLAGPRTAAIAGVNTSLGYLGLASAGALGGVVLGLGGAHWLAPVSGVLAGVALLCHLGSVATDRGRVEAASEDASTHVTSGTLMA